MIVFGAQLLQTVVAVVARALTSPDSGSRILLFLKVKEK